jgi:hypothetical protein
MAIHTKDSDKFPHIQPKQILEVIGNLISTQKLDVEVEWAGRGGGVAHLCYKELEKLKQEEGNEFNIRRLKKVFWKKDHGEEYILLWDVRDLAYRWSGICKSFAWPCTDYRNCHSFPAFVITIFLM